MAISTNSDLEETTIFSENGDYHLISTEEANEYFKDIPEAVENTGKIAGACDVNLTLGKFIFPDFPLEPRKSADQMLEKLTLKGAREHGLSGDREAMERLRYEFGIIKEKGYSTYFLVVADLIRFAREAKIYTTVRGSVAGSLVAYLSGITNVNPIEFQLPFERFLNPFRPSAPDIDMDFADNRRQEVIDYAKNKYGADKVAQIGTFGTMLARGAVRDVARAYALAAGRGRPGEGYLVCTGSPRRVGDILDLLLGMIRVKVRVERDPALVRPSDPPYGKASYARLEADTGWRPEIPFEQTVRDTLDYWRRSLSRKAV